MITLDVKTKVDTTESESSVDRLTKSMDKLVELQEQTLKEQSKLNDEVAKSSEETKKSLSNLNKATKLLAGGFKGVGLAIKAAGLKLLFGAMNALKDVFMQNQEVADTVASSFKTVSIIFNQVVGSLISAVKEVSAASNGFEKLGKVMSGLLTLALTPFKLSFYQIVLSVQQAQLAWESSFFGDKDPTTIKELINSISETKKSISEVGQEAVKAGTKVVDNFAGAVSEVSDVVVGSVERIKETSIEAAIEQGKSLVELEKAMAKSETTSRMLQLSYQKQAEDQRQIRDDETKTFQERIEANEKLARILKEAAEVEKAEVQKRIDNLKKEQKLLGYKQETADEIYNLTVEQLDIEERLGGIKSEQLTNQNSLIREQKSLANELSLIGKGEVEKAKEEALQEREQRLLDAELAIEDEQAKKDALLAIEQEYQNKLLAIDAEAKEKSDTAQKASDAAQKASDDKQLADAKKKESMKMGLLSDGFKIAGELSSKNAKAQKGIAATEATINTLTAITGTLRGLSTNKTPGLAIAQAVATGVFGMLQVQKILSSSVDSGSSPSVSSPSGSGVTSASSEANQDSDIPNFDFINQGVGGNAGARLNRSYVVNQDIKDQNQLAEKVEDISVTA